MRRIQCRECGPRQACGVLSWTVHRQQPPRFYPVLKVLGYKKGTPSNEQNKMQMDGKGNDRNIFSLKCAI